MALPSTFRLLAVVLISAAAGAMNSIAGGGTLLTFPALVGLGITPLVANATSTVALWPGSFASMLGYRNELSGAQRWALGFALPSLLGGGVGAWLLLRTPPSRFEAIVPWLVLGATTLFILQPRILRSIGSAPRARWLLLAGLGVALAGGVVLGVLAWASAGAAGPGRLVDVGPSPVLVGLLAALEIGVAATIGLFAGSSRGATSSAAASAR